ncbi:MAG: xanthine dehydrogenase small subunit [Methylobacterium sp.]|nr:xanthine dehydrogenase small subunit [Methylobacterium sp.]MCA3658674.1 xanthine dehydrogenase small subunit [Methylobacterium sp.]MCA3663728.1 xanthine dehydrogenase small subunit [Methylobacterium sp.]MCA3665195.1 xanthine dehydrogenase small subunit [Methylobacterium sp.]MCA3669576.1 xanthine dehydrogenase small subunit [Methylobacterium sp.]
MRRTLRFIFRGQTVERDGFDPTLTLLEWLREEQRATGTKEGCNEGDCGACTVVLARLREGRLRYEPVNACILLLGQVDGAEVLTVEDLSAGGTLHPIQQAMVAHHGSQCGFCTPGIVMSLFAAYHEAERPLTRAAFDDILSGNLCRCTGYRPIADAALAALRGPAADAFANEAELRRTRLEVLQEGSDLFIGHEARFFAAPASIETMASLALRHPDATLLAGGTDVGLWITKKLQDLGKIIWLGRVKGLDRIEESDALLTFWATVTHERALPRLARLDPDLDRLMRRFGSRQVRASGTLGGNIANGSPIGDLAPALIALDASVEMRKGGLSRTMPLENFFLAYGRQAREPGEVVTALHIPKPKPGMAFRAFKISKRFDEDISAVMGAFRFRLEDGRIAEARLAYGGMAGTPARARATEQALEGVSLSDTHGWATALSHLEADFQPISDMRASAGYRAKVARAVLGKALLEIAGAAAETRIHPRGEVAHAG